MENYELSKDIDLSLLKNVTVLYVEDDKNIQSQLSYALKRYVKSLCTADNGEKGFEAFKTHKPDIVITDIRMPVMSGLEMAKKMKKHDSLVPIIVTTAYNETNLLQDSIEIGIDRYVFKPTDPEYLLECIYKCSAIYFQKREVESRNRDVRFILDTNPNFIVLSSKNNVEYINKTFLKFLGYTSLDKFKNNHKGVEEFFFKLNDILYPNETWMQYIIDNPKKDHIVYLSNPNFSKKLSEIYIITHNKFPHSDKYIFSFTDITRTENEKLAFKTQAMTDALTGLSNRLKFDHFLVSEYKQAKRINLPLSLIMFDIDNFKHINDTQGHHVGDSVLKELADIVHGQFRKRDMVARWAGDEFSILTPEIDLMGARLLAEKVRAKIEKGKFSCEGKVTCSFGVIQLLENENIDDFVKRVDSALYNAKRKGRNRIEVL